MMLTLWADSINWADSENHDDSASQADSVTGLTYKQQDLAMYIFFTLYVFSRFDSNGNRASPVCRARTE
jgi:hypothetical protein